MKKLLFVLMLLSLAVISSAQVVDNAPGVAQSKQNPTKSPSSARPWQVWKNTQSGAMWKWDNANRAWVHVSPEYYGEAVIEQDTLTLVWADSVVTPDTLRGLTAGLLNGFVLDGDFALRYTGERQGRFLLNYSATFTFTEAGVISSYIKQNTTVLYKTRLRHTVATAGDNVNVAGSGLLTLQPGDRVSLFFFPTIHTGSDTLSVYECNMSLTQIK